MLGRLRSLVVLQPTATILAGAFLGTGCVQGRCPLGQHRDDGGGCVDITGPVTAPAIALTPANLAFSATQGGAGPASQRVLITNSGGGTLSGLSLGTISYGPGATGWLSAPTLSSSTPNPDVVLTVRPVTASLTPGTYTASVPVQSQVASNSPQNLTVTFTVAPAPLSPTIALNPSSLTYNAMQGGANPASQLVTITNSGGGTLSGLSLGTISYGPGAAGWLLAPTLSGTTANPSVSLVLQPLTGALAPGSYTATVPVQSAGSSNSPQSVAITFLVAQPAPVPPELTLAIAAGDNQTAAQNTIVATAPAVRITDARGDGVAGVALTWVVGGGLFPIPSPLTDANGFSTLGYFVPTVVGPIQMQVQTIETRVGPPSINFSITGTPVGPLQMTRNPMGFPEPQNGVAGLPVTLPPSVKVSTLTSQPAVGIEVRFNVRSGGGALSLTGGLTSYQALTDLAGVVTVPVWVLGSGPSLVEAAVGAAGDNLGVSPVTFTANVQGPSGLKLAIAAGDNQTAVVSIGVAIPPAVRVTDLAGAGVANIPITWTILMGAGTFMTGTPSVTGGGGSAASRIRSHTEPGEPSKPAPLNSLAHGEPGVERTAARRAHAPTVTASPAAMKPAGLASKRSAVSQVRER